jgi:hypothetical protein
VKIRIGARHRGGVGVGEERHALFGMEVILHPELLARSIDPHVGVGAIAIHVPPRAGQPSRTHQIGHLVRRFGIAAPEIPLHVIVAKT